MEKSKINENKDSKPNVSENPKEVEKKDNKITSEETENKNKLELRKERFAEGKSVEVNTENAQKVV